MLHILHLISFVVKRDVRKYAERLKLLLLLLSDFVAYVKLEQCSCLYSELQRRTARMAYV